MPGLTDNGFERKTLTEILDSLKTNAKTEFGASFNTNDDSVFTQLAGTFALELDEIWQGLEGTHSAYTYSGAEGVHLDDLFSRHNIIRLSATQGSGTSYVEADNTIVLPETIPITSDFVASNGITYSVNTAKVVDIDATSAYKILNDDITFPVSYTIFCEDDLGATQSTVIAVNTSGERAAFVTAVKAFVDVTNTSTAGKTQDFPSAGEFYLGFDSNKLLDPLAVEIEFYTSPAIGNRYTSVASTADVAGNNPLPSGGISDLTPKFTGFVSATNVTAFNSGSNVETDPEFRARFNKLIDASATGCDRASIETALLGVTNVSDARIYENPTATPTAEAAAYSYNSVVFGGASADIAQTLFDNGPINVSTDGTTTVPKTTSSGDTINIKYTVATSADLNVRITYDTVLDTVLTDTEQDLIKAAIADLALNFSIGTTVYTIQLTSAIVSAVGYGRFTTLTVENKRTSEGAGSYTTADFVPLFTEFPQIADGDISFVKV